MTAVKLIPCPECAAPRPARERCRNCGWKPGRRRRPKPPRQARGYDAAHTRLRRRLIDQAEQAGGWTPCAICGRPLDVTLPGTHPAGPHLHHLADKHSQPARAALAHGRCNQQAGAPA